MFLQGLSTPLFYRLGKRLQAAGAIVARINFCAGDFLFWPGKATNYRGPFPEWSSFLEGFLQVHRITDVILFGDYRPYHRVAMTVAQTRDVAVHVFEEGVLRPHWITMESDRRWRTAERMTPKSLLETAACLPQTESPKRVAGGFAQRAYWDVAFHICNTLAPFIFPHYRRHRPHHPLVEGCGWLRRLTKKKGARDVAQRTVARLISEHEAYFLLPLQLDSDAQIRFRSPYANMAEVLDFVLGSFARSATPQQKILIKGHPLDNGLIDRQNQVAVFAHKHGISSRVEYIEGGHLPTILEHSQGVVLVNSTVGLTALHQNRPLFVLAEPTYKVAGLTAVGELDSFWGNPEPPDSDLVAAFEKVLMDATQINGSFFNFDGIDLAIDGIVRRLCSKNSHWY